MRVFVLSSLLLCNLGAAPAAIELTCVDDNATGYGTFQSHNQKVLANGRGIFMTHLRTRNEAYTAQQWRLSRSTDGGRTFTTLYEATHATHPPAIETDEHDNVYLFRSDLTTGDAYLHAFLAANDYREPRVTPHPPRRRAEVRRVLRRRSEAVVLRLTQPLRRHRPRRKGSPLVAALPEWHKGRVPVPPPVARPRGGPALRVDERSVRQDDLPIDSPHQSPDGGVTWRNADGSPLKPPIVADDTGPAARVNLDDELDGSSWLSSFCAREGKGHFLYMSYGSPPRQHYVRYDLKTGKRELDVTPTFKGETVELSGLDGFFAASKTTLYCVGHTPDQRIGCLASDDNGTTWRDHAISEKVANLYAVGGCRDVTREGFVIGSFTTATSTDGRDVSKVYFLRISTAR